MISERFKNPHGIVVTVTFVNDAHTQISSSGSPLFNSPAGSIFVPFSFETVTRGLSRWIFGGTYLQDALSFLDADQREFVKTGITPAQWAAMFPPEDGEGQES